MNKILILTLLCLVAVCSQGFSYAQVNSQGPEPVLIQNTPNPFEETTTIKFQLKEDCFVKLYVKEAHTGSITMLVEGDMSSGEKGVIFKSAPVDGSAGSNETDYTCILETYSADGKLTGLQNIQMKQAGK
ncbi:MAG: hypothetical protein IAE90_05080 [Ignavibacteria bacterium]|nr:hypothetical protein [Ignavibacteria bacterium]